MAERDEDMLVALRRIMRAADLYSRQLSKRAGLTTPQLLVLQAIRDLGDVTIGTIARRVNLSQATVTTILDRLEQRRADRLLPRLAQHRLPAEVEAGEAAERRVERAR